MNLSKFVADDVILFIALLKDVFTCSEPKSQKHPKLEETLKTIVREKKFYLREEEGVTDRDKWLQNNKWFLKIIQL